MINRLAKVQRGYRAQEIVKITKVDREEGWDGRPVSQKRNRPDLDEGGLSRQAKSLNKRVRALNEHYNEDFRILKNLEEQAEIAGKTTMTDFWNVFRNPLGMVVP